MIAGDGPYWVEGRHMYLARIRFNRPVLDVDLPERLVTVPTSDGDVLVSGETFDALWDSMIGSVDVGPDLRDVPLDRLDLADLTYELSCVPEQVARPRTNLGSSGPPGRID